MKTSKYTLDGSKIEFISTGNHVHALNKKPFSKYAKEGDEIFEMVSDGKPLKIYWAESTIKAVQGEEEKLTI